nr:MAG TPA: hypothetical protein [Caudoviricetes sp.]
MNDLSVVNIGDTQFNGKTLDGKPVLTFRDIDAIHHRPEGSASRNFRSNRQRFIEGEDFFKICADEFRHRFDGLSNKATEDVYLFTESGYLMIVKSFTDDWAWEVQRKLVKTYFRAKELAAEKPKPMSTTDLFALQVEINREYESKLAALEGKVDETNRKFDAVTTFVTSPLTDADTWQERMTRHIRRAVEEFSLNYQQFHAKLYDELERTAGVDLKCRQTRMRNRMYAAGATKTECKAVSKLSVIAADKKLRAMFETILRNEIVRLATSRAIAG